MDLLNMLLGTMTSSSSLESLVGKVGGNNDQIMKLVKLALPILIKFLTKNAGSADGAASLLTALAGHTQKRSMADQIKEADEEDGGKIVSHILGEEKDAVVQKLVTDTELSADQVNKGLASLAPALMSGLSAAKDSASKVDLSDGLDLGDLMGMFGGEAASEGGLLAGIGNLLGGLFGGKAEEEAPAADAGANGAELLSILTGLMK